MEDWTNRLTVCPGPGCLLRHGLDCLHKSDDTVRTSDILPPLRNCLIQWGHALEAIPGQWKSRGTGDWMRTMRLVIRTTLWIFYLDVIGIGYQWTVSSALVVIRFIFMCFLHHSLSYSYDIYL